MRFAQAFTGAAFEEDVVGNDDRSAAVLLQNGEDVLEEVELFVSAVVFAQKDSSEVASNWIISCPSNAEHLSSLHASRQRGGDGSLPGHDPK